MSVFRKVVFLSVIWITYFILYKIFYPISTIDAVNFQFTNSPVSSSSIQLQQIFWDWAFIFPTVISVKLFTLEIKKYIKKVKEQLNK